MLEITITGTGPFDGTFPLALDRFNGIELHLIKAKAGVRFGEIDEALGAGDYDAIVALAVIALMRDGRVTDRTMARCFDELMRSDLGAITAENKEDETAEADDGPPSVPPSGGEPSRSDDETLTLS